MVQLGVARGMIELPNKLAVPVKLLDPPAFTAARAAGYPQHAGAEQMPVRQKIRRLPRLVVALPTVDDAALVVDQMRNRIVFRRHQGVTRKRLRCIEKQADGLTGVGRHGCLVLLHGLAAASISRLRVLRDHPGRPRVGHCPDYPGAADAGLAHLADSNRGPPDHSEDFHCGRCSDRPYGSDDRCRPGHPDPARDEPPPGASAVRE